MHKISITTMSGGVNDGNVLQNDAVLRLIKQTGYTAGTLRLTTKNGYPDAIPDQTALI